MSHRLLILALAGASLWLAEAAWAADNRPERPWHSQPGLRQWARPDHRGDRAGPVHPWYYGPYQPHYPYYGYYGPGYAYGSPWAYYYRAYPYYGYSYFGWSWPPYYSYYLGYGAPFYYYQGPFYYRNW